MIVFSCPYDHIYFFWIGYDWSRDANFKYCLRIHSGGVLVVERHLEHIAVPPLEPHQLYVAFVLQECVECCCVLTVPIPPILKYYSSLVVDDRLGAAVIWPLLPNNTPQWCWWCSFMLPTRIWSGSSVFQCYDPRTSQGGFGRLSCFLLAFAVASIITASHYWSRAALLIPPVLFGILLLSGS